MEWGIKMKNNREDLFKEILAFNRKNDYQFYYYSNIFYGVKKNN